MSVAQLPFRLDATVTRPDGTVIPKVRIVYRSDGLLQGIALGDVVFSTSISGDVIQEGSTFTVPTPQGTFLFASMKDCGCGG